MNHLPSTPSGSSKMNRRSLADWKEKYLQNFITQWSLLYNEKQKQDAEMSRLNGIIEEQKQTIVKLTSNSKKSLVNAEVQTDEIVAANVETQTEKINVVDAEIQTGMHCIFSLNFMNSGFMFLILIVMSSMEQKKLEEISRIEDELHSSVVAEMKTQQPQNGKIGDIEHSLDGSVQTGIVFNCLYISIFSYFHSNKFHVFLFIFVVPEQFDLTNQRQTNSPTSTSNDERTSAAPHETNSTASSATNHQQLNTNETARKRRGGPYICDCGYDCKYLKSRLKNHQSSGACPKHPRTDPLHACPVCFKEFTFSGLKSHLKPFTKPSSRSTYNQEHSMVSVEKHKQVLEEVILKFGPKKLTIPLV